MRSYSVAFKPSVEKDLRELPAAVVEKLLRKIQDLPTHPLPPGVVKLEGSKDLYRIRFGNYRVVYKIDKPQNKIIIQHVRHRRDAYRNL
jgi:mRNA interferase RelE/StbE